MIDLDLGELELFLLLAADTGEDSSTESLKQIDQGKYEDNCLCARKCAF